MKKSMIFAGLLAVGYANAQYDGKVGVNTEQPNATFDIKSYDTKGTASNIFQLQQKDGTKLVTVKNNNGRTGIGTDDPQEKLHVKDASIRIEGGGELGGYISIVNRDKPLATEDVATMWRIYNTTGSSYGNTLQFWAYPNTTGSGVGAKQRVLALADTGNIGIGTAGPTQKLDIVGNARLRTLPSIAGTDTDKVVVVDNTGVLKTVARSSFTTSPAPTTATNGVQNTTGMACNDENRGKMNFGRISISGKETDAMGFCMKNGDNEFRWYYIYGGAAHTVGTNATFGQGL